jgi:hypothetical protein
METRLQNLKDHISRIEELLGTAKGLSEVPAARELNSGWSVEQLSALKEWKSLSSNARRILTLYFSDENHSMVDAVATFHPEKTHDVQKQVAANLLANKDVKSIIDLFFGRAL